MCKSTLKDRMSPGQTGHITGQMGRVPGTDGTHTRGCPAKILYVYWFFFSQKSLVSLGFFKGHTELFGLHVEDHHRQNPGISPKKFVFPAYRTFSPPPLHVEDPHPTGRYLDPKVWVCAPFSCLKTSNGTCGKPCFWVTSGGLSPN